MRWLAWFLVAFLATLCPAHAQVKQAGNVTPGHIAAWATSGVIQDPSQSAIGGITSLPIVGTGTPLCIDDAQKTSQTGYRELCLGANSAGQGILSFQAYGGASQLPFFININGTNVPLVQVVTCPADASLCGVTAINAAGSSVTANLASRFNGVTNNSGVWTFGTGPIFGSTSAVGTVFPTMQAQANYNSSANYTSLPFNTNIYGAHIYAPNIMHVTDASVGPTAGADIAAVLSATMDIGGSSVQGTHITAMFTSNFNSATFSSNANRFYSALGAVGYLNSNDNGTTLSPVGAFFGGFSGVNGDPSFVYHVDNVTAWEFDLNTSAGSGSNIAFRSGIQVVAYTGPQIVRGQIDAGIVISGFNDGGTQNGLLTGILFCSCNGSNPMDATSGNLVDAFAMTVDNGFILTSVTFNGDVFLSPNYILDNDGDVFANTLTATLSTLANSVALEPAGTGVSPSLNFGGSDTNVGGAISMKGLGGTSFNNGSGTIFSVGAVSGTVTNFAQTLPATTGNSIVYGAAGSDSTITITLEPKGASASILTLNGSGGMQVTNVTTVGTGTGKSFVCMDTSGNFYRATGSTCI